METKRVGIVGRYSIFLISLIIIAYIIFLSITYWNCAKITLEICEINKCDFSIFGFKSIINMKDDCCGNTLCEVGESYPECIDCPNCVDENNCTADSFDYNKHECVNEPILDVVCCGNTLCEEGYETNSDCPKDCPSCDDNSRLTADSFDYMTQECENIVTHYFIDDFESGTQDWSFFDWEGTPTTTAWSTIVEDGNTVLKGTGHNWADLVRREWSDYIFKFRFKRVSGSMHVNFRLGSRRYFVNLLNGESVQLRKWTFATGDVQTLKTTSFSPRSRWHTMEIRGYEDILNVYIDNVVRIKYKDTEDAILSGRAAFEMVEGEFLIDDVEIKVVARTDVVYP